MGFEGYRTLGAIVDEIQVFGQQELPIAEVALDDHIEKTGHKPFETQDGWVCTHYEGYLGERCFAAWPPPSGFQLAMERAVDSVLRTGRYQAGGVTVEYPLSPLGFSVLPDAEKIVNDGL